jgi:hypothetical protein
MRRENGIAMSIVEHNQHRLVEEWETRRIASFYCHLCVMRLHVNLVVTPGARPVDAHTIAVIATEVIATEGNSND